MVACKMFLLFALVATVFSHVDSNQDQEKRLRGKRSVNAANSKIAQLSSLLNKAQANLLNLEARIQLVEANHLRFLRGRDGRDGQPGINGRDGKNGQDGKPGAQGFQGEVGPAGNSGKDGQQGPPGLSVGGLQYVRWGKTTCPSGADLVYRGYMGGEHYTHAGGGVNYLCLTRQPKYLNFKPGFQVGGRVYGAEYQVSDNTGLLPSSLHDHEPPCVACHVKTRSAKMMVPGTYECPTGWTREYYGYLMTAHFGHAHPADFICVDENAEAMPGTHANLDGALLYPVQGTCGSLPCKPYIQAQELTCAVCTK